MKFPIPDSALDDRLAILGTAGSGKTYLALTAIERLLSRGARVILVDPLGVGWGLRLDAEGTKPSPFNIPIFGGAHGDLGLTEHAGAIIGETVAKMRESCIIDLSGIGTKAGERRFMLAFLTALYRNATKDPVHLIVDESDMFAPQRLLDKEGEAAKLLGMMETIVRRGRIAGFIPWLITQRPAVLSKDVLSQADGLVALKLTSSQDRDAIGAWIEGQADKADAKAMLASLPGMERGHGVVWIPGRGILETSRFPEKRTFDSSRTPKRGEKRKETELTPLDLSALKDRLAKVQVEAKANDPKALRAELAALKKQMADAIRSKVVADPADLAQAEHKGYSRGKIEGYAAGISDLRGVMEPLFDAAGDLRSALTKLQDNAKTIQQWVDRAGKKGPQNITANIPASRPMPVRAAPVRPAPRHGGENVSLPPGERAVLIAAAQFDGIEREQLTVLTGYKRSSRDAYIQRLREKSLIELAGQTIRLTAEGEAALPADYEPLPTGADLQAYWLQRLPEGERRILQALIDAYPNAIERSALDDATGYKRSSRDAYLQRMKAKRLWDADGSAVRASEALFT